jgi:hypothetical protein
LEFQRFRIGWHGFCTAPGCAVRRKDASEYDMENPMNGMLKIATFTLLAAWSSAQAQAPVPPDQPTTVREWPEFDVADANGDGYISKQEGTANSQLMELWDEVDTDRSRSLSIDEYAKARERQKIRDLKR